MEVTAAQTLKTAAGDACASCGAPLAPDQRYCVQCGQRRGPAQLPAAASTTPVTEVAPVAPPRAARAAGGATAVAGVATLLIAMGVGVLIGRSGQHTATTKASPPVQVVTVGGGAAAAAAPAVAAAAPAKAKRTAAKKATATPTPATKNVKGTDLKLPPKSVVKLGQPGKGPGYQNGKFTGNFFGN